MSPKTEKHSEMRNGDGNEKPKIKPRQTKPKQEKNEEVKLPFKNSKLPNATGKSSFVNN